MKKIILSLIAVFALTTAVSAQNNAIGIRLAAGSAFGAEISYQTAMAASNRIEIDLGMNFGGFSAISLAGMYHWQVGLSDGFGLFIGPGAQAVLIEEYFSLGVGGQAGIEYSFPSVPFQISLDVRPMYNILSHYGFYWGGALGIRYTF